MVNSKKNNLKQSINFGADSSANLTKSTSSTYKLSFAKQLLNYFSVSDDYSKLQLAIICLTFFLSLIISISTVFLINEKFGLSLFVGSITGIFYLRLLAKSIGNLGKNSSGVSKAQLLLPVCLFIFASKNELIDILPSIIGFFLYKPALFFYFSRS
tara:strand:+ start:108 stop:575 length:468 start_codon:yes stop_codon:yes gene_type:complete